MRRTSRSCVRRVSSRSGARTYPTSACAGTATTPCAAPPATPGMRGPAPASPVRVAVTVDPAGQGVDPDVAAGVRKAAAALKDAGYVVEDVEPPAIAQAAEVWARQVIAEVQTALMPLLEQVASPDA